MCPDTNSPEDSGRSYEKQPSDLRNQNSDNRGTGAPPPHECPLNRNCRAKCLAWQAGGLPETLRWFRRNHKWHESGPLGNQVKLRLVFKKRIRSAVNTMLLDRLDGLTVKIEDVFGKLQRNAKTLDDLCVNRINDEDELVMLEHTMAYLDEGLAELADLIEGAHRSNRKIVDIPPEKSLRPEGHLPLVGEELWVTCKEAGKKAGKHPGTIGRWVQEGRVRDNGKKRPYRRVLLDDVLRVKQAIEDRDAKNDADEIEKDKKRLDRELTMR